MARLCFSILKESSYVEIEPIVMHENGNGFVGSKQCISCHSNIYESHIETAHYLSSAKTHIDHLKGDFSINNKFYLNDSIYFKMIAKDNSFYQEVYALSGEKIDSRKLDITIGSGTKGQTHLNWQSDSLFQLQVSYFTVTDTWANSPGYALEYVEKQRPIESRCLECHTTFARQKEDLFSLNSNIYERSKTIYGIDCERCHGPALKHLQYHSKDSTIKKPMHIKQFSALSRQQRLDACALCHSGSNSPIFNKPFEFIVGDRLDRYPLSSLTEEDAKDLDVHGNQYDLMVSSACFKFSKTMDCATCHNVHKNERGDKNLFNSRCLSCHNIDKEIQCSVDTRNSQKNQNNCVGCHMPLIASKSMFITTDKDSIPNNVEVRSHYIGIYDEMTP